MTSKTAPGALKAVTSSLLCTIGQGLIAGRAGARLPALETVWRSVAAQDQVAGTATANVEDRSNVLLTAHFALKLLVEAEDGAFTAAMNIASATAAGLECRWILRIEAGQRWRTRGS